MRIAEFALEGNGAWPDLRAEGLTDGVTVFCGPKSTGKSTVAGFITHVLYGRTPSVHETSQRRMELPPEGELIAIDRQGRFRLRRYNDVAPPGRLTVSSIDGDDVDRDTVRHLLSGVSPAILRRLYALDRRDSAPLDWILSEDFARDFRAGTDRDFQADGAVQNPDGQHNQRDRLHDLLDRRDQLTRQLEDLVSRDRRTSVELNDRIRDLDAMCHEREQETIQLREQLRIVEGALAEVSAHLRYDRVESMVDQQVARAVPADLDEQLADLDEQIERWRAMLSDLQRREATVRGRQAELHPDDAETLPKLTDQIAALSVMQRIAGDLEGETARLARSIDAKTCLCRDAHGRFGPLVEALRRQIESLQRTVADQQRGVEFEELTREAEHLERTKSELSDQLEHLLQRRQTLLRSTRASDRNRRLRNSRNTNGREGTGQFDNDSSLVDLSEKDLQTRQNQLERERADLVSRLRAVESRVAEFKVRRQSLANDHRDTVDGASIDAIRRELATIQAKVERELNESPSDDQYDPRRPQGLRASDYLAQMSDGEYVELRLTADGRSAVVKTRFGGTQDVLSLGESERYLVYLSLALAIIADYARHGIELPLVLDEPFSTLDSKRQVALAGVLHDFSRAGHQVLIFSSDCTAVERFQTLGCQVRNMSDLRLTPGSIDVRPTIASIDDPGISSSPLPPPVSPVRLTAVSGDPVKHAPRRAPEFELRLESPMSHFPALGRDTAQVFAALGVRTVGELVEMDPDIVVERLKRPEINVDVVRLWQTHICLLCFVAGVTLDDAQVLTGAGIHSPDDLCTAADEELASAVEDYLDSDRGQRFRQAGYEISATRIKSWIRAAQRNCDSWRTSRQWQRWDRRIHAQTRRPKRKVGKTSTKRRAKRPAEKRTIVESRSDTVRFYLEPRSHVEEAPSIGPKTAAKLEAIGIHTVADLLGADPIESARALKVRNIKADTIVGWQKQARLMCEVPQLRGHDAQILVACGFVSPAQIAEMEPRKLFAKVTPFCESKEGERVLRGGKQPDLQEVTDWIAWASRRRTLEAA